MKRIILFGLLLLAGALTASAQRGLKEIPNPDVRVQEAGFKLPPGAKINLFAADPQITKPIHMNWDGQGRLWVVGSPLYPHIKPGEEETDRLYVLEDTNGDGIEVAICEAKGQGHHLRRDLRDAADIIALNFMLGHRKKQVDPDVLNADP